MLLEVPTGLHFTELEIESVGGHILQAVWLAESCGRTLVDLSYRIRRYGKSNLSILLATYRAFYSPLS